VGLGSNLNIITASGFSRTHHSPVAGGPEGGDTVVGAPYSDEEERREDTEKISGERIRIAENQQESL